MVHSHGSGCIFVLLYIVNIVCNKAYLHNLRFVGKVRIHLFWIGDDSLFLAKLMDIRRSWDKVYSGNSM